MATPTPPDAPRDTPATDASTAAMGVTPDGAPAPHRRSIAGRVARWTAGTLGVVVLLAGGTVLFLTNTDAGREVLRKQVVKALAGTVHGRFALGRVSGNLLKGITLHDLAITDSTGAPFLKVDSATTKYGLRSFFSKRIELSGVTLWRPVIVLDRRPGQDWNWARIFPSDTTKADTSTAPGWGDFLVFHDARIVNGDFTVRTPWAPADSLGPAQRDSAVRAALDTASRSRIERVPGGWQNVQFYRELYADLPLVRLADPEFPTRRVEVDSLRLVALPLRPPAAVVRQARGALELDGDSLWFRRLDVQLPGSRTTIGGRYAFESGALALAGRADPLQLADARLARPSLPEGIVRTGFAVQLDSLRTAVRLNDLVAALPQPGTGDATARGTVGLVLGPADSLRLDGTNVTVGNLTTALVERLVPGVDVPRTGVIAGRVAADGTLERLALDADATFDDAQAGRSRITAAGELGVADGVVRARGLRVGLAPVQVALARIAAPDLPVGGTVTGTATLDGSTATALRATGVDLTHLDRGARSRVTGGASVSLADASARARGASPVRTLSADLRLQPLSLATVGRFAPAAGLRGTAAGPVRVRGTLEQLVLDADLALSGGGRDGGRVAARGRVGLGDVLTYDLAVDTRRLDAGAVTTKAPVTAITGPIVARGRGTDPATMTASLSARLTDVRVDTALADTVRAGLRVARGLATVDTLAVRLPRASIDALGTFGLVAGRSGELAYRVAVDSAAVLRRYLPPDSGSTAPRPGLNAARLARARADSVIRARVSAVAVAAGDRAPDALPAVDTLNAIPRDSLAGAVYAAGVVRGNVKAFDLRGRAGVQSLVALGNRVGQARVAYSWLGALRPEAALAVAVQADSLRVGGFQLDSIDARGTWREPGGTAQVAIFQDVGRSYSARAQYAVYPDRSEATFDQLRLRFDTTVWASTRPGAVRWGKPGLEVVDVELVDGRGGRIFADGRLPAEGPADLRVQLRRFQLADALGLAQSDVALRGLVSLDAALTGTGRAPRLTATAALDSADYRGTAVPAVRARADYADRTLRATAEGIVDDRRALTADATVPIDLALQGVTGPRLAENATVTADARLDSLPLDLAQRFTDAVSDVRGAVSGTIAARGALRRPTLTGTLTIPSGQAKLVPLGITLRQLAAAVRLNGDTVVVDSIAGTSIGRIRLAGGVGIRDAARPSFDMRLTATNARVIDGELGRLAANANIRVAGPFDRVVVTGNARVLGGTINIPESSGGESLSQSDPAVFAVIDTTNLRERELVPAQSPLLANLQADVRVSIDRDTWVRNREANVEIYSDGPLRVQVDQRRQALVVDGTVSTDRGEYEYLSKRFQVKTGTVTFLGTQEIDPNLQLVAEYDVRQTGSQPLTIRILVGGQLSAPRISLESDAQPPIPQSDLLTYLAFGQTSGALLSFGGSSISGRDPSGSQIGNMGALATTQLTSAAFGVLVQNLERQTARSLGADQFNITPSSNVAPELVRGDVGALTTLARTTQIEYGRYFNRRLFVGLQTTPNFFLVDPPVPGFRVQYRFLNIQGLSLESTYQPRFFPGVPTLEPITPAKIQQKNSLGAFLSREWRY